MPIRTRHTNKAIRYIRWNGQLFTRNPPRYKGHFRVFYWYKGDAGATWVKADIYYPNGKIAMSGALAQSLQNLKQLVPKCLEHFELL